MKRLSISIFVLILQLSIIHSSFGQFVWPGDVNDNGIVNGVDALYVGLAYDAEGPTRPGASADWVAQPIGPLWGLYFPNGINYAYADCDGNGKVEEEDISDVIKDNFGLTHGDVVPDGYSGNGGGAAPKLELKPQIVNVGLNQMIHFDLWLGDEDNPVQNFYGIVLEMSYNPDFTLGSEWEYEDLENVWLDPSNDNHEDLLVVDEPAGKIDLAFTRTNQQTVSGAGKIGQFTIVIEDIIVGLQRDTLHLQIDRVLMIDKDFNKLSVVPDSAFVVISRPDSTKDTPLENAVSVFPNPATESLMINSEVLIRGYELMDATGRKILSNNNFENTKTVRLPLAAVGTDAHLCFLKIHTERGVVIRKIIIQ